MQGSILVGRVGGLAVALGLGVAAAYTGAGCAQAGPEDSSRISADARTDSSQHPNASRGRSRVARHSQSVSAASIVEQPARRRPAAHPRFRGGARPKEFRAVSGPPGGQGVNADGFQIACCSRHYNANRR